MAARFWVGGSGTWDASDTTHWAASSGAAGGETVPGLSDTVTIDAASGAGTITVDTDFSIGAFTCGAMGMTLDFSINNNSPTINTFSCSGTGTRTLKMGSGTWSLYGGSSGTVTVFDISTTTNLTLDIGTSEINATYTGSIGVRIFRSGDSATYKLPKIKVSAGSAVININGGAASAHYNGLDFTGFSGTMDFSGSYNSQNCYGDIVLSPTMTCSNTTGGKTISMLNTGAQSITTNGVVLKINITINAAGNVTTLQDALDMTNPASATTLTLTAGTFNTSNFNVTCGIFSSSNSNVRTLTMGSGTWTITGNNTTVWQTTTTTNLTITATTSSLDFTYSGATGTRTCTFVNPGSLGTVKVSGGTDIVTFNGLTCSSIDFTGFSGTFTIVTNNITATGNLTLGTGMTSSVVIPSIQLTGTGSQTIRSNGVTLGNGINLNGTGGTWTLQDAFSMASTKTITLTKGTLDANNMNVTCGIFSSNNSNTRTITMGTGTWTLTGTGTVWNTATVTNLTLNPGTSTIIINDASAASKTFSSGVATFYDVLLTGVGTGTFILGAETATTTFNNIEIDTPPHTVQVYAGKTLRVGSLSISGTYGALNTIRSTTGGTPWNITSPSSVVSANYISLQDSVASGSIFYAGADSVDVSGNTGWLFLNRPLLVSDTASRDQNYVPTLLANDSTDPTKAVSIYANPDTHGLVVNDRTTGADQGSTAAARDKNYVPAMVAVSSADGVTPVLVYADSISHQLLIDSN